MKNIKFLVGAIASSMLVLVMIACGGRESGNDSESIVQNVNNPIEKQTQIETDQNKTDTDIKMADDDFEEITNQVQEKSGKNTLVVVFSATGTTKGVAEKIASITDADFYEIIPAEMYTSDDLNYNDSNSRASMEQNDSSIRPEIESEIIDISGYERIYIGYPIWFGQEPRIMDTFVEAYDFGSITMIPFCTSGSSGIGQSGKHLEENAGSGKWLEGQRFSGNVSEDDLRSWINGLQ